MHNENKAMCKDIYDQVIEKYIKTRKRFREVWLKSSFYPKNELFQYADDDFYFYRFAVSREEHEKISLLNEIIYGVLERYKIDFEALDMRNDVPFEYLINTNDGRFGYTFEDFRVGEDINELLKKYNLDKAYIIRTVKSIENKHIIRNNRNFIEQGLNVSEITLQTFFETYFSKEEYCVFETAIMDYITKSRNIMGYQSIKVLSTMNLSVRKLFEEKILNEWDYEHSKYQIIDQTNSKIQNIVYVGNYEFKDRWGKIQERYLGEDLFKVMLGKESFAESFITAEWLYYSLKGKENFDYTSIISGYLKSIEQLLYKLVMLNIDNNCIISLKTDKDTKQKAITDGVIVYEMKWDKNKKSFVKTVAKNGWEKWLKFPYIDFTSTQKEYMDSSIGTFEYFLRNNPNIYIDSDLAKVICDMVSCFRTECRNSYFHTQNLHDETIVDKVRENAILLYFVLLGSVKTTLENKNNIGIEQEDKFDLICKEIRRLHHYSADFTFMYADGTEKKMIYDSINNTPEFAEDGVEHYDSMIFYEVEKFLVEIHEKVDTPIRDERRRLLTRETLPKRIFCFDMKKNIHEVTPELLQ